MRILVFSDSHGSLRQMAAVIKREKQIDLLLHVGDHGEDIDRVVQLLKLKTPYKRVKGNCDYNTSAPRELIVDAGGVKILLTHGNKFAVKIRLNRLYYHALEQGANIAIFGHTHLPSVKNMGDMYLLNPGSIAVPKGKGLTYSVIEIDEKNSKIVDIKMIRFKA